MVFSAENSILIKVLRQEKGYGAKTFITEFPNKQWTLSGLKSLLRFLDFSTGQPACTPCETMQSIPQETPHFITPALWPANSPGVNPVDYRIWGKLEDWECVDRSWFHDVKSTSASSKTGNISSRRSSMKRSGSGAHVFELAPGHAEDILNTDFRCVIFA